MLRNLCFILHKTIFLKEFYLLPFVNRKRKFQSQPGFLKCTLYFMVPMTSTMDIKEEAENKTEL